MKSILAYIFPRWVSRVLPRQQKWSEQSGREDQMQLLTKHSKLFMMTEVNATGGIYLNRIRLVYPGFLSTIDANGVCRCNIIDALANVAQEKKVYLLIYPSTASSNICLKQLVVSKQSCKTSTALYCPTC